MKTQVFINTLYLHKNCIVMKLQFSNQDVKEIREVKVYKDCLEVCTEIDQTRFRGRVDQKVDIQLQKYYKI